MISYLHAIMNLKFATMHTIDMSSQTVGVPLIAVNPFQNVAELYDGKMVKKYKSDSSTEIKV